MKIYSGTGWVVNKSSLALCYEWLLKKNVFNYNDECLEVSAALPWCPFWLRMTRIRWFGIHSFQDMSQIQNAINMDTQFSSNLKFGKMTFWLNKPEKVLQALFLLENCFAELGIRVLFRTELVRNCNFFSFSCYCSILRLR